jgi:hypothetical protein
MVRLGADCPKGALVPIRFAVPSYRENVCYKNGKFLTGHSNCFQSSGVYIAIVCPLVIPDMKKIRFVLFLISLTLLQQCFEDENGPQPINDADKGLAARWADITLNTVRNSFPNSPTYTSRCLGYTGLTMYESIVHGSLNHRSLSGQLNGLGNLPSPEAGVDYHWAIALNAGQAYILKSLYPHANTDLVAAINELESTTYLAASDTVDDIVAERSVAYGMAVAEAVFEWAKTDGGHGGYLVNFDPQYEFPTGPPYWTPPVFGQSASKLPLHPHWGNNRTFVTANSTLPIPEMVPYAVTENSACYDLFKDVYEKRKALTAEEQMIAAWWADDPTQTASPPGHSYNLATIAITTAQSDIFTAAEIYAKVGMAVADAFICCWKCKYTYHSVRPFPYINANIDPNYRQFWPEPPFPAFPSGHATQSAAAAVVMISVFGNNFPLVDNTYANRPADFENIPYHTRSYHDLWASAEECAHSRFLGGIHTAQDNEAGTAQGKDIGENIVALSWSK